jgi:DNA-binding transcriptional LysR family regulator
MDLRQLRYFVAVHEEGSFTRAARRENVSQPSLSVQVAELEAALNVRLFDRHPRGTAPTSAGKRLYDRAIRILRLVGETVQEIAQPAGAISGAVRVGLPQLLSRSVLTPLLTGFAASFPAVDVQLVESYSGTLTGMVMAHELDFAVVTRPPEPLPLRLERFFHARFVLATGPAHGLRPFAPVDLRQLPPLKLVVPSATHSTRTLIDDLLRMQDVPVARLMEIDGLLGTLDLVSGSDWVSIVPLVAIEDEVRLSRVTYSPIVGERLGIDYYAAHVVSAALTLPAQRFHAMLRTELARVVAESELLFRAGGRRRRLARAAPPR